ncbi:GNAT family N-acetyltransferase [Alkalihalobacillus pseudalcaliphilus]|uniref:GNAT family N-acetyltransferase n=1 Tax=Alkalihalobacillus pseudalcaliphilus TaxID=79884 RepID=UPI00064D9592|nr:GNAT family N-acetyltransferase [Alkalihalobacillus pseudalcaliphilus]KMK78110.1 hypothetical protein AB990_01295 [Alkalihalobacillus pseudalcaliphilus]
MLTTREAVFEELTTLSDFWLDMIIEMNRAANRDDPDESRKQAVYERFVELYRSEQLLFRVALNEYGEIVACAGGVLWSEYLYPLASKPSLAGWVVSVYTKPDYRGRGLARQLVKEVLEWHQANGCQSSRLWSSESAEPIYQGLGFKQLPIYSKRLDES